MIISSLRLRNIRSYEELSLEFPEGSVLVSGDVGSGKSTLLYAIEFALFGLMRGELSASSLLRHGTDEGEVSLSFLLGQTQVSVRRTLRNEGGSIKQGPGSLSVDGVTESLMPTELRARILDLLEYPPSVLSSSKSLLFRFTVYTPQEEMKRILFEDADTRLGTLRMIFGIDQYKTAKDNVSALLRSVRSELKALGSRLEELPLKNKELQSLQAALRDAERSSHQSSQEYSVQKASLVKLEQECSSLRKMSDEQHKAVLSRQRLEQSIAFTREHILSLEKEISVLGVREPLDAPVFKDTEPVLTQQVEAEQQCLHQLARAKEHHASLTAQKSSLMRRLDQVRSLGALCPVCSQPIDEEHSLKIAFEVKHEILGFDDALGTVDQDIARFSEQVEKVRRNITKIRLLEKESLRQRTQYEEQLLHQKERLGKVETLSMTLAQRRAHFQSLTEELSSLPAISAVSQEQLLALESRLTDQRKVVQSLALTVAQLQERLLQWGERISTLEKEVQTLKEFSARASRIHQRMQWLSEIFLAALDVIEQTVFSSIHSEFSNLLSKWFSLIISDDDFSLSLDEHFSPLVEQNGFVTEVASLSGGEKTAVALAYRLALNQCINDFVPSIGTRDLLLLDEPTDGFSEVQLERMKEVFDLLSVRQLIIVSHESKIEGLVQSVIRVGKDGSSHVQ